GMTACSACPADTSILRVSPTEVQLNGWSGFSGDFRMARLRRVIRFNKSGRVEKLRIWSFEVRRELPSHFRQATLLPVFLNLGLFPRVRHHRLRSFFAL